MPTRLRLINDGIDHRLDAYRDGTANQDRRAECKTKDGHKYTGHYEWDGNELWFWVIDNNGNEYETQEQPVYYIVI